MTLIRERFCYLLLLAFTAAILLSPLAVNGRMLNEYDYVNHIASIVQAKMALMEGQFPLRSMPFISSWGYPLYQFYSSSSYCLAGFIYQHVATDNPYTAYKLTLGCALLFGGFFMFRLTRWMTGSSQIGLLTSVAYISSPYYIIILDHLGAFTESIALGMLPAVLFYSFRLYYRPKIGTFLLAALVWYFQATMHIITFTYASLFFSMLFFCITIKTKLWKSFFTLGLAYLLGCVIAAWFLAPILVFKKILFASTMFGSKFDSMYHIQLNELFSPVSTISEFAMFGSFTDLTTELHPSLGMPFVFGAGCCIYLLINRYRFANTKVTNVFGPLLGVFFIGLIFVWSANHLWAALPEFLKVGQYSWRLLGQINWMAAILFAIAATWVFKNEMTNKQMFLGCLLIIFANSSWLKVPESSFIPSLVNDLVKRPLWAISDFSYNINASQHPKYIDVKNAAALNIDSEDDHLQYGKIHPYQLPSSRLKNIKIPSLVIKGVFQEVDPVKFTIFVNNQQVKQVVQPSGVFTWEVPLPSYKSLKPKESVKLFFTAGEDRERTPSVKIDSFFVTGFQDPETIMRVDKTESYCHSQDKMMVCIIPPLPTATLVELPFHYYPEMLHVYLNNKKTDYLSVMSQRLVVGKMLQPGKVNIIKLQFKGLPWANIISLSGCVIWLVLLFKLAWTKLFSQRKELYAGSTT